MSSPSTPPLAPPSNDSDLVIGSETLMFAALLILSVLGAYVVIRLRFSILPESSVAILLGAAFGAVLRAFPEAQAHEWWSFQPEVFFYALLPPIIFEAGYTLKRRLFLANLSPILLFAVLGTVIATFALGGLLIGVSQLGWLQVEVTPGEAMVFGALISAVDPVATLSVLSSAEVNADPMLVSILFGESVLNDAIAIVLFQTLTQSSDGMPDSAADALAMVGRFAEMSICSTLLGVAVALLLSLLLRHTQFYQQAVHLEISLTLGAAYVSYVGAEALGLSGVLSLFFCGAVLGHYNFYNLSSQGKVATLHLSKVFAFLCETLVFAYIGISLFDQRGWEDCDWQFVAVAAVGCQLARALNIFPLSWILNCVRTPKVPWKFQLVLWWSGLRGAMAFALALNFPGPPESQARARVTSATIVIVLVTTLGLGGLVAPLVRLLGVNAPEGTGDGGSSATLAAAPSDVSTAAGQPLMSEAPFGSGLGSALLGSAAGSARWKSELNKARDSKLRRMWRYVDRRCLQRWFGGAARRPAGAARSPAGAARAGTPDAGILALGGGGGSYLAAARSWLERAASGELERDGRLSADDDDELTRETADELFWLARMASNDPFVVPPARDRDRLGTDPAANDAVHQALLRENTRE